MIKRIFCDVNDYKNFFALQASDLDKKIIECNSGFNSFNASMLENQTKIISCDSLYQHSFEALKTEAAYLEQALIQDFEKQTRKFSFSTFPDFEAMMNHHQSVAQKFFLDYENGKKEGRYLADIKSVSSQSTAQEKFDILLMHYLFANETIVLEELFEDIQNKLNIAPEIRIFPLLNAQGESSPHLAPLCLLLQQQGIGAELKKVNFEWESSGHVLLIIRAHSCGVLNEKIEQTL